MIQTKPKQTWEDRVAALKTRQLPRHIAVIMDGNGRWAKRRGLPRIAGHREGVKSVREMIEAGKDLGIEAMTFYTFSTENWNRPRDEVSALWSLLVTAMNREIEDLKRNNVKVRTIGDLSALPPQPREEMFRAIRETEKNTGIVLTLAINYSGRSEIIYAINTLLASGVTSVTEDDVTNALMTKGLPDPDLLIRTSGEMRISNFLLWQIAYAEIFVTDIHWPDFRKEELAVALDWYQTRERRFGKVSEQLRS
ncbi:MAG: isoprenyl transferase [bacterium]|nr:isoprenyl transferase [bacterium]